MIANTIRTLAVRQLPARGISTVAGKIFVEIESIIDIQTNLIEKIIFSHFQHQQSTEFQQL